MVDVSVEPRWGRVSEGAGEDPFLGSKIAAARVRGFQGKDNDLSDTLTVLATVKHFAAYGAPQAGRDYNTVDMSERTFLDIYLPPYKAAIDAGAMSVMTSFNELDGVPATGSKYLMTDLLRDQLGFKGFVVTDYTSINEMVHHGVAADDPEAGLLAIKAGVDMDMQGEVYFKYLKKQVEDGLVDEKLIDQSVRRVLKVKFMLGLFDDPYRYCNPESEKRYVYAPEHLEAALDVAKKSMVLLKNDNQVLPLSKGDKLAVIGELATSTRVVCPTLMPITGLKIQRMRKSITAIVWPIREIILVTAPIAGDLRPAIFLRATQLRRPMTTEAPLRPQPHLRHFLIRPTKVCGRCATFIMFWAISSGANMVSAMPSI